MKTTERASPCSRITTGPFAAAVLVAVVVALYYVETLSNDFVWDDRLTAAAATDPLALFGSRAGAYYRPVVMLSFAADRLLWGPSAAGYHLTNIACHTAVACLLLVLARQVGLGPAAALIGALVFAAHPVQTEAVSYISGRTDPLCGFFVLLAVHAWRRAKRASDAFALASAAALLLALLSKEAAVFVPLVLLVPGVHPATPAPRPLLPIGCAAGWLALWAQGGGTGIHLAGLGDRLAAIGVAAATYLRLLVWPSDLHLERFTPVLGWPASTALACWALIVTATTLLVWAARRVPGGPLWLTLAAATYAPVSGIAPAYPNIADRLLFTPEHFLYLPLLGLGPLLAGLLARLWPFPARPAGPVVLVLLLGAWGCVVAARNRDWRDEETLFRHTLAYEPPVARVWFNLGNLRLAAGDLAEATDLYRAALARSPGDAAMHFNLGIALQRQGHLAEAETHYARTVALDPTFVDAYRALGAIRAARRDHAGAQRLRQQADGVRGRQQP